MSAIYLHEVICLPWAPDGYNFSERIWNNKEKLLSELNTVMTQNIMTGAGPQKAIDTLAKKMNTSRSNAGRLVMTESAYFSSLGRQQCFKDLDVEKYEIVATLDGRTSETCRHLDGKVFDMKDFQAGVTAPPFHVRCRTTTAPYFDDDLMSGQRVARGNDGGRYYVPGDITYEEWALKRKLKNSYGNGIVNNTEGTYRKTSNQGAFVELKVPMQKRAIKEIARAYGIDISGLKLVIQKDPAHLNWDVCGSTDPVRIGRVDLMANAFRDEEQMVRTLVHEKVHVKQFQKYGRQYVHDHRMEMEAEAYAEEGAQWEVLKNVYASRMGKKHNSK